MKKNSKQTLCSYVPYRFVLNSYVEACRKFTGDPNLESCSKFQGTQRKLEDSERGRLVVSSLVGAVDSWSDASCAAFSSGCLNPALFHGWEEGLWRAYGADFNHGLPRRRAPWPAGGREELWRKELNENYDKNCNWWFWYLLRWFWLYVEPGTGTTNLREHVSIAPNG